MNSIIKSLLCSAVLISFLSSGASQDISAKVVLVPLQKVIISSKVNSTVSEYRVKEGNQVKKGDTLALLDNKYFEQQYNNAKASVKEAESRKDFATYDYKQKVQLFQRGAVGKMDVEESKLNSELAVAKYTQAMSKLKLAEYDLKACNITAPFNGRIVKKIVQEHEYVRASEPILELINDKMLLAVMHFPSNMLKEVKIGNKIKLLVSETGKIYNATITEISANVDAASRTFEVKAAIENAKDEMRSGMSGKLIN